MISSEQGFLFEMHLHTAGVSTCAHVPAEKSMRLYKQAGYAGVVVTDHINSSTFALMKHASWKRKMNHFLKATAAARNLRRSISLCCWARSCVSTAATMTTCSLA